MSYFETLIEMLGPWSWHVAGLLLLGLEILAPGTFFLWFGVSALIVGTLALFVDLGWQANLLLFMGIALVCLLLGRKFMKKGQGHTGDAALNQRGQRYVGRQFVLGEPISQGTGRLNIDDTVWRVRGPDMAEGTRVTVMAIEGASLVVEAVAEG